MDPICFGIYDDYLDDNDAYFNILDHVTSEPINYFDMTENTFNFQDCQNYTNYGDYVFDENICSLTYTTNEQNLASLAYFKTQNTSQDYDTKIENKSCAKKRLYSQMINLNESNESNESRGFYDQICIQQRTSFIYE